eukprot:747421-Amphidinium_carterae.1
MRGSSWRPHQQQSGHALLMLRVAKELMTIPFQQALSGLLLEFAALHLRQLPGHWWTADRRLLIKKLALVRMDWEGSTRDSPVMRACIGPASAICPICLACLLMSNHDTQKTFQLPTGGRELHSVSVLGLSVVWSWVVPILEVSSLRLERPEPPIMTKPHRIPTQTYNLENHLR